MVIPSAFAVNAFGEVNWMEGEMRILSDEEALHLMDTHVCVPSETAGQKENCLNKSSP